MENKKNKGAIRELFDFYKENQAFRKYTKEKSVKFLKEFPKEVSKDLYELMTFPYQLVKSLGEGIGMALILNEAKKFSDYKTNLENSVK